jgi:orotate phosphoribosyltransferase
MAASAIQSAGGVVVGVLAVVDREEGGREAIEQAGHTVAALATAAEILPRIPA